MNKPKKIIRVVALVIILFLILFITIFEKGGQIVTSSTFNNYDTINNLEGKGEKEDTKTTQKEVASEINKDIIGRIKIDGTNIDNILVQTDNNEYYLNHLPNGEKDSRGTIFMDYRNNTNDRKLLIYGHNSETLKSAPFHDLEKYLNESFYKQNKYVELTLNDEKSTWEIFSVMILEKNDNRHMKITFNDSEWIKHLDWMKNNSIYNTDVEASLNDRIITLQTCYYEPGDSYLIINAKKIK